VLKVGDLATASGWLISTGAPADASFSCAMTEAQARRMTADSRVRHVAEAVYLFHDGFGRRR
jgi:hypothetical protein